MNLCLLWQSPVLKIFSRLLSLIPIQLIIKIIGSCLIDFQQQLTPEFLEGLTPSRLSGISAGTAAKSAGKIITSSTWYYAAVLPAARASARIDRFCQSRDSLLRLPHITHLSHHYFTPDNCGWQVKNQNDKASIIAIQLYGICWHSA
mgnify:CR=1 FL=1